VIGQVLVIFGFFLLMAAAIALLEEWRERCDRRELNERFRENQRLWRHG
jgi:hypothetical protein